MKNNLRIPKAKEVDNIKNELESEFGITKVSGTLLEKDFKTLFLFTGELVSKELDKISVEKIGLEIANRQNEQLALTLSGTQIFGNQISKNIFELNDDKINNWLSGNEIDVKTGHKGFLAMKYKKDFFGCGKASDLKISNLLPKHRRLKLKN